MTTELFADTPTVALENGNYRLALFYIDPQGKERIPVSLKTLLAELDRSPQALVRFADVQVDFERHEVRRGDHVVELTSLEFKVLRFFVENPRRVVARQELLEKVWGFHCYPNTRTVDNQILHLRRKLEAIPAYPVHFKTIHGVGYKFVP